IIIDDKDTGVGGKSVLRIRYKADFHAPKTGTGPAVPFSRRYID
ncbi:unnamed protein product, partial [Rotaria magnacalcarata]